MSHRLFKPQAKEWKVFWKISRCDFGPLQHRPVGVTSRVQKKHVLGVYIRFFTRCEEITWGGGSHNFIYCINYYYKCRFLAVISFSSSAFSDISGDDRRR